MISPFVRRLRLARELKQLRTEKGYTHEQLAKRIGQSRAQISRLENGHVADQEDVMKILDALDVDGDRWTTIMTIAREAGERGWWESNRGMGDRQALIANLEAGAATIREYQMTFVPGLLQTLGFARSRSQADRTVASSVDFRSDKVIEAREGRQRMLRRPNGPEYDVILDEMAIRRLTAPPEVMKEQLYHVTAMVNGSPKVRLRILPIDARIDDYNVPRSAFSAYTFPDPHDPHIVAVDTVTEDLILNSDDEDGKQVERYEELHKQLTKAAMPEEESLDFVIKRAKELRP